MNKNLKIIIGLFVIILIALFIFMKRDEAKKQLVIENLTKTISEEKEMISNVKEKDVIKIDTVREIVNKTQAKQIKNSEWNSYTNDEIGIAFKYPQNIKKNGDDIKAIDKNGIVNSIEIHFNDTVNNNNLDIKYNPNPNGTKLYNYKLNQYNKSEGIYKNEKNEILIAGKKAIVGISIRKVDGRGHVINPPSQLIVTDMLCNELSGKLEIQFRTKADDNESSEIFYEILKTLKLLNN